MRQFICKLTASSVCVWGFDRWDGDTNGGPAQRRGPSRGKQTNKRMQMQEDITVKEWQSKSFFSERLIFWACGRFSSQPEKVWNIYTYFYSFYWFLISWKGQIVRSWVWLTGGCIILSRRWLRLSKYSFSSTVIVFLFINNLYLLRKRRKRKISDWFYLFGRLFFA